MSLLHDHQPDTDHTALAEGQETLAPTTEALHDPGTAPGSFYKVPEHTARVDESPYSVPAPTAEAPIKTDHESDTDEVQGFGMGTTTLEPGTYEGTPETQVGDEGVGHGGSDHTGEDEQEPDQPRKRKWPKVVAPVAAVAMLTAGALGLSKKGGDSDKVTAGPVPTAVKPSTPTTPNPTTTTETQTNSSTEVVLPPNFEELFQFSAFAKEITDPNQLEYAPEARAYIQQTLKQNPELEKLSSQLTDTLDSSRDKLGVKWGTCVKINQSTVDKKTGQHLVVTFDLVNPIFATSGNVTQFYASDGQYSHLVVTVKYDDSHNIVATLPSADIQVTQTADAKDISLYYADRFGNISQPANNISWKSTGIYATTEPNYKGTPLLVGGLVNFGTSPMPDSFNQATCDALVKKTGVLTA